MRPCDIDQSGEVWIYTPQNHKNSWRGQSMQIALGPRAQKLIKPYLNRSPEAYLFSPREAEAWRLSQLSVLGNPKRKTPIYPSELRRRERIKQSRRRRKSKRPKRDHYDTDSYRQAIMYGLKKALKTDTKITSWHPHQLRHTRGTEVRKKYGLEAAQVALGHARANVTEIYAEKNFQAAIDIARESG